MKFLICDVRISELLTKQVSCVPWEVPILEALHGGNVKIVGEEEIDRDPPSPGDEYLRLTNRYRGNKEEETAIVAQVYGSHQAGVNKLREEMRAAGVDVDAFDRIEAREVPQIRSSRMSRGIRGPAAATGGNVRQNGTPNRVRAKPTPQPVAKPAPATVASVSTGSLEARKAAARQARERFAPAPVRPPARPAPARPAATPARSPAPIRPR